MALYSVVKKRRMRLRGSCERLSALQIHCSAETLERGKGLSAAAPRRVDDAGIDGRSQRPKVPDDAVKGAGLERHALAHVVEAQVAVHLAVHGDVCTDATGIGGEHGVVVVPGGGRRSRARTEHVAANVKADPVVARESQLLATEARSAAEARVGGGEE